MYALHYSWLTKSMCSRLDSWQARTLRGVLRIKASMISRVSNSEVLRRARTRPLSAQVADERVKFLGHILRRPPQDTVYNVCFDSSCKVRLPVGKRRQKRPLDSWTRKSVIEVLSRASRSLPVSVRPNASLQPLTSGSLYARNISYHKTMWCQLAQRRTNAPAGSRAGPAGTLGVPLAGPAAPAPRGAG